MPKAAAPPIASTSRAPVAGGKKPSAFEIDDIFASKPKPSSSSAPTPAPAPEPISSLPPTKSKKSKGKKKVTDAESTTAAPAAAVKEEEVKPKARVVEVVDTSAKIEAYVAKQKAGEAEGEGAKRKLDDDELAFMDSRGTQRRKTDDGLPIYDASELKIGLGGETPECPFDCNCCF